METTTTPRMLLSVPEAAYQLNISRATLYRLLARGDLVSVRIGARVFVPQQELDSYVDRRRQARLSELGARGP
jgi:excisionase family DNA binding protein